MIIVCVLLVLYSLGNEISSVEISVYQTSKYTSDRITKKPSIFFNTSVIDEEVLDSKFSVHVNSTVKKQTILGFGGALTESSAIVFNQMSSKLQDEVLDLYYEQNKYSMARLEINSCDFSTGNWSSDDVKDDYDLDQFQLSSHDTDVIIPFVKRVLDKNKDLRIFACPWSPPGWMKKSGKMDGSEENCLIDTDQMYETWSNYFVKWVESYKDEGVNVSMVTTQNEPVMPSVWESCTYDADHLTKFTKILTPKMNSIDVKVIIFDDQKDRLLSFVPTILSEPINEELVYGIGFHWYDGSFFEDVEKIYEMYPSKVLMGTEHTYTKGPIIGSFSRGEGYAYDIIGDFQSGSSAWVDWNIILNQEGGPNHVGNYCDAPILYDTDKKEIVIEPMYYYMGQFSRFVKPDKTRVVDSTWKVDGDEELVFSVAFSTSRNNELEVIVVVMNKDENDKEIKIIDHEVGIAKTVIPKRSITTFSYVK